MAHAQQRRFIANLRSALGTPYVWGGTSLQNGVDCSGLVWAAARAAGIHGIPRVSQDQFHYGQAVSMGALRPGDLIFSQWGSEQGAGHVSVYLGGGKIIEAYKTGAPVTIHDLSVLNGHVLGARRILRNPAGGAALTRDFPNAGQVDAQTQATHGQALQQSQNLARRAAALAALQPYRPNLPDRSLQPTAQQNVQQFLQAHQPKPNAGLQALQALAPAPQNPYTQALTPQLQQQTAQGSLDALHQRLLKLGGSP